MADPILGIADWEPNADPSAFFDEQRDDLIERHNQYESVSVAAGNVDLTATLDADGDPIDLRRFAFRFFGTPGTDRDVEFSESPGLHAVWNDTGDGSNVVCKTNTDTTGITVADGEKVFILIDASNIVHLFGGTGGGGSGKNWSAITPLQTTDATTTTLLSISLSGTDQAVTLQAIVQGRQPLTGDSIHANIFCAARNEGGATTFIGGGPSTIKDAGVNAWTITTDVDDSTDVLRIRVRGEASHTIDWTGIYVLVNQTD